MHLPMRAIAVFHAAARAGSVSRAAQELGVTPSAVSQQIASLELYLGTSLMVKSGRRVALTEAGERYFEMIAENVEAHTLASCGHFMPEERPEFVIGHILDLSARVAAASSPRAMTT